MNKLLEYVTSPWRNSLILGMSTVSLTGLLWLSLGVTYYVTLHSLVISLAYYVMYEVWFFEKKSAKSATSGLSNYYLAALIMNIRATIDQKSMNMYYFVAVCFSVLIFAFLYNVSSYLLATNIISSWEVKLLFLYPNVYFISMLAYRLYSICLSYFTIPHKGLTDHYGFIYKYDISGVKQISIPLALINGNLFEIKCAMMHQGYTDSRYLLVRAVQNGHANIVRYLIEKGADVNQLFYVGLTPLHYAVFNGHIDIVKYLVECGADVNIEAAVGAGQISTPFHRAVYSGRLDIVEYLVANGADISKGSWSPLYCAVSKNNMDMVKYLVRNGVDVNQANINMNGETALHCAAYNNQKYMIKYLLDNGANINQASSLGLTALHCAATSLRIGGVKCLLEKGANLSLKDNEGYTPLCYAMRSNQGQVVSYLLDKGANINQYANIDPHFKLMVTPYYTSRETKWVVSKKDFVWFYSNFPQNSDSIQFVDSKDEMSPTLPPASKIRLVLNASELIKTVIPNTMQKVLSSRANGISEKIKGMPVYSLFKELRLQISLSIHYQFIDRNFQTLHQYNLDRLVKVILCFEKHEVKLPKEIYMRIIGFPKEIRMIHYRGVEPSQDCREQEDVLHRFPHWIES